jgi:hypothetical protein
VLNCAVARDASGRFCKNLNVGRSRIVLCRFITESGHSYRHKRYACGMRPKDIVVRHGRGGEK